MNLNRTETEKNFKLAFAGELEDKNKYTYFAKVSKKDGFPEITEKFRNITKIEKGYEERYQILLENLRKKKVFNRTTDVVWFCRNCGYVHIGADAPLNCPICNHPQSYFEIQAANS